MRIIDGRDWSPRGVATTWLPTASMTAAHDNAPDDPTPASFLQADHVRAVTAQRAQGRRHRAFTCSVATLPGIPDLDRMTRAIEQFVASHEGLRSSLRVEDDGNATEGRIRRRTVPRDAVDLKPVQVDEPVSELLTITVPEIAVFDHVPAMAVVVVAREDGTSFDLLYALDHSAGDGISQMTGLLELMARYTGQQIPGLTDDDHPGFPSYVREELLRAQSVGPNSPGVREWAEQLRSTGGAVPSFPLPTGIIDGEPQPVVGIGGHEDGLLADGDILTQLRSLAKENGTSFSTVVYAILGLAHRRLTGEDHYATVVVSSTRGQQYQFSQGWFCNFNPLHFPVRGSTLSEVLPDVAVAQAQMKTTLFEPVHASLGVLVLSGQADPSIISSPQMVTYLDLGWFHEPAGANIRLFTGFGNTSNANLWIFRNPDGLGIGSQAPDNSSARESLGIYFDTLRTIIAENTGGVR